MGHAFSSANSIWVHLDRPFYNPGDAVNGVVLLNCVQPFKATTLVLKVEGYEECQWVERRDVQDVVEEVEMDSDGQEQRRNVTSTRQENILHGDQRDFFKIKLPLQSFNGEVLPGQWQWPFSFVLPSQLPGSFEFSGGRGFNMEDMRGKVAYKVKAEAEVPGLLAHALKHKAQLTVQQAQTRAASEAIVRDVQRVTACCCCDRGTASITARLQKDIHYPGEVAQAILEVDNQSSAQFSGVLLELRRRVVLRTRGAPDAETVDVLGATKSPGVKAGEVQLGMAARSLALQLPPALLPTTVGSLVQCTYTLTIKLQASTFTSSLEVHLPVTIYQAVPPNVALGVPPPGWKPEVMPPVQLALPSAPPMPPPQQAMSPAAGTAVPEPIKPHAA